MLRREKTLHLRSRSHCLILPARRQPAKTAPLTNYVYVSHSHLFATFLYISAATAAAAAAAAASASRFSLVMILSSVGEYRPVETPYSSVGFLFSTDMAHISF